MSEPARWFRRVGTATGATLRLACFPHAGGTAGFFREWATHLPSTVELVVAQYPGREVRIAEPCLGDLHRMADHAAAALGAAGDLPLALFGHSMGALLAFEVALRIESHAALRRVFISGRPPPQHVRKQSKHLLDDDTLCAEIGRLGGTHSSLLHRRELRDILLPALRADLRAVDEHVADQVARLHAPLSVFIGDADPDVTAVQAADWRVHTGGAFELAVFSGGHFYLSSCPADVVSRVTAGVAMEPGAAAVWPSTP